MGKRSESDPDYSRCRDLRGEHSNKEEVRIMLRIRQATIVARSALITGSVMITIVLAAMVSSTAALAAPADVPHPFMLWNRGCGQA